MGLKALRVGHFTHVHIGTTRVDLKGSRERHSTEAALNGGIRVDLKLSERDTLLRRSLA